jgi:hypothetical protein
LSYPFIYVIEQAEDMATNLEKIAECFFKYAVERGNPYDKYPLSVDIEEFGAPYIEISESGKLAIVAKDRGEECLRKETTSPEVMAKWVYEIFNKER